MIRAGRSKLTALVLVLSSVAVAACRRAPAVDPAVRAGEILSQCGSDWSCVHERWRRDPHNWNCGLRSEVAWKSPDGPVVVTTTREIANPAMRESGCLPGAAGRSPVYYRTSASRKDSGEFPFMIFHWASLNEAASGQKQVLAAVARARGSEERLWRVIEEDSSLDAACVRFLGKRDRCDPLTASTAPDSRADGRRSPRRPAID